MVTFQDRQVRTLYNLARDADGMLINDDQKVAIGLLRLLAQEGNTDAQGALAALLRSPGLHPMLREMAAAGTGSPVQMGV